MPILGTHSKRELIGVDGKLVLIVQEAIKITKQDFTVHDGIRTIAEQRELVRLGASQTMNSKHIIGRAVDLVPYINGKLRWEWIPIYMICEAMRNAAKSLDVDIRWGGAWNINLTKSSLPPKQLVENYVAHRKSRNKRAFIDGPHYELID